MSSNFPISIDSFVNPQYTKVNGVDYVKAEHINDLQDAVKNLQLTIIGSGLSMNLGSNNYIPESSDIKSALEILDGAIFQREDDFQSHISAVMATDSFQHHANVVEVTPIGNLSSDRLQWALEEIQNDIDNIMSGGIVNSLSLDNRYILAGGVANITGTLTVQGDGTFLSNVVMGSSTSHTVDTSGDLTIGRNLIVAGNSTFGSDIIVPDEVKIGAESNSEYTNISFHSDKISLKSFKDIEFQLDSDDSIDGENDSSEFKILNGNSTTIFDLLESGQLTVQTKVSTSILEAGSHLQVGSAEIGQFEYNKLSTEATDLVIQIDSDNSSINDYFAVTQDGDSGSLDTSTDILFKAKSADFIAGSHVQKRGAPERGYFGIKFYSDNAGGKFQGYGINFKSKMLTVPSSITLNVDTAKSENYSNLSVTDINEYGFFIECDSLEVGNCEVKGTYETVGN